MTRERRDRIDGIAKAIYELRNELLTMRLDEIHELPLITDDMFRRQSSCEHITEIRKATDLFADGLCELGY